MKKWFLPLCAALLLLTAVGCDKDDTPPLELPDTVDELTVVTTPETEEQTSAPETTAPETEAATELPAEPETEPLSEEEARAMLDALLLDSALNALDPMELTVGGELRLTAELYGFSGTTTIPLSGHFGHDSEGDVTLGYTVPMMGTGFITVADNTLYLYDGNETALRCPLEGVSAAQLMRVLLYYQNQSGSPIPGVGNMGSLIPDDLLGGAMLPEGWLENIPDDWFGLLPEDWFAVDGAVMTFDTASGETPADRPLAGNNALKLLLCSAMAGLPLEESFQSVTAYRTVGSGEVTIVLSGLSESFVQSLQDTLALVKEQAEGIEGSANGNHNEAPDESADPSIQDPTDTSAETAAGIRDTVALLETLIRLLEEQAEDALTLSLTVTEGELTACTVASALDLSSAPELTSNIPTQLETSLQITFNRDNIQINQPESAEDYTEVTIEDLLPPTEEETETEADTGTDSEADSTADTNTET